MGQEEGRVLTLGTTKAKSSCYTTIVIIILLSLQKRPNYFQPIYKNNQKMAANTAPIKYAQRKDSLYLTIAVPGMSYLIAAGDGCCCCWRWRFFFPVCSRLNTIIMLLQRQLLSH
jgi:hypothetical protein